MGSSSRKLTLFSVTGGADWDVSPLRPQSHIIVLLHVGCVELSVSVATGFTESGSIWGTLRSIRGSRLCLDHQVSLYSYRKKGQEVNAIVSFKSKGTWHRFNTFGGFMPVLQTVTGPADHLRCSQNKDSWCLQSRTIYLMYSRRIPEKNIHKLTWLYADPKLLSLYQSIINPSCTVACITCSVKNWTKLTHITSSAANFISLPTSSLSELNNQATIHIAVSIAQGFTHPLHKYLTPLPSVDVGRRKACLGKSLMLAVIAALHNMPRCVLCSNMLCCACNAVLCCAVLCCSFMLCHAVLCATVSVWWLEFRGSVRGREFPFKDNKV